MINCVLFLQKNLGLTKRVDCSSRPYTYLGKESFCIPWLKKGKKGSEIRSNLLTYKQQLFFLSLLEKVLTWKDFITPASKCNRLK